MNSLMIPRSIVCWKECRSMDRKELMNKIRSDLRERPNSHFSEIYFRVTANRAACEERLGAK
jgi:hypothetical protein